MSFDVHARKNGTSYLTLHTGVPTEDNEVSRAQWSHGEVVFTIPDVVLVDVEGWSIDGEDCNGL